MKLSIITITYNSKKYLSEAIESVLGQDYRELEYILVDGGSTDGTLDVIRQYAARDSRIRWISERDRGIADAMNKGVRLATGEVVAHIHSDDSYLPRALSEVVRAFQDNSSRRWVTGLLRYVNEEGAVLYDTTIKDSYSFDSLMKRNLIGHPATFLKRELFEEVGLFDESVKYAMDYDLWLRITRTCEPLAINKALATFRFHQESLSSRELINAITEEYSLKRKHAGNAGGTALASAYLRLQKDKLMIRLGLNNALKKLKAKLAA